MTLLQLAEPIFQYVCALNREARVGSGRSYGVVKDDIRRLLKDFMEKAKANGKLLDQARKIELPLIFFVDSMIAGSRLNFAQNWHQERLAFERNERTGDDKFFAELDAAFKETGDDASERLAIYYSCLWLGFQGRYDRKPEQLRRYMDDILPRIPSFIERNLQALVCQEAYEGVDRRDLTEPRSKRLGIVLVVMAVCGCITLVAYCLIYYDAAKNLSVPLEQIEQKAKSFQTAR
jgi:type IV/VI secretion system ImpK/VasF family protein